ncbi:hypothetical protein AVEN_35368-1 [Araneus ventricosus]|uniref:Reverse transcriptase zinc-binding domain-containing protein n=1 Tax=Araneus ventricosus TaxID=182803 RepID=A0A4Y2A9R1_ARAVE|nr:hypothetical protein AVEN_35368-1 [Araneus ventricosus]
MTNKFQLYPSIQLPKSFIKTTLRNGLMQEWQNLWDQGDTDRQVFAIIPRVSLQSSNWIREDTIFFSEHGPFPAYLHRFGLTNNNLCSCGEIGSALHYATDCILTSSWHMRTPRQTSCKNG